MHEAVRAELAARRRGTASTQTRGEVSMTGAKAWRQKGTGRARVGALSTPNRVGGGVAFGPKPRSYTVKVNRKARRRALRAALSLHADRGSIAAIDPSKFDTPSTKAAVAALAASTARAACWWCSTDGEENCLKSFRNLADVTVLHADQVGVADVIGAGAAGGVRGRARAPDREGGGQVNARQVIMRPVISEKSYALLAANKYTFRVHEGANKTQVRQAIEEIFGVRVTGVRTAWVKPKPKRRGFTTGQRRQLEEGGRDAASRRFDRALRGPGGVGEWRSRSTSPPRRAGASRPTSATRRSPRASPRRRSPRA